MKISILYVFLLCSSLTLAQELTIDEDNTHISFYFQDQEVSGTMSDFIFMGQIDLDAIESATISGSVASESLDTDNWFRNRHLRSTKYFSSKTHPRIYFKSTLIESTGQGFRVSGTLTIKGITQEITWFFKNKADTTFVGTTTINTQDFDIYVYDKRSRNEVSIMITIPYKK
ncbi:YceI family protein [Dokdonia sp.]|uniref:YceI family protein n=1 Tax=Dokdonia sp. TaxID=2024995 RepID=UPI003264D1D1